MSGLICDVLSGIGFSPGFCRNEKEEEQETKTAYREDPDARSFLEKLLWGTEVEGAVGCTSEEDKIDDLIQDLNSSDEDDRISAARELRNYAKSNISPALRNKMISPLIESLSDNQASVRRFAIDALEAAICTHNCNPAQEYEVKLLNGLIRALSDEDDLVSQSAGYFLGKLIPVTTSPEKIVAPLLSSTKHNPENLR